MSCHDCSGNTFDLSVKHSSSGSMVLSGHAGSIPYADQCRSILVIICILVGRLSLVPLLILQLRPKKPYNVAVSALVVLDNLS